MRWLLVKIKEVIVVEGKNDTNVLKSYVDCDTIETHGISINKEVIEQIRIAKHEVSLFLQIRIIQENIFEIP